MVIIKHALKTSVAAALLAGIFQHSDLAHIPYPVMGLLTTMLSFNVGDILQAGWGRLGGSLVGGSLSVLIITAWGNSPLTGGLAFILASLLCQTFQWTALVNQAGIISALIVALPQLGDNPWQYTFDRLIDNGIGVLVAILMTLLFWPDNPRQILNTYLDQVVGDCDRVFQTCLSNILSEIPQPVETTELLTQIAETIKKSESILEKSHYGWVGHQLVQDNWSDIIAIQRRLRRHLLVMSQLMAPQMLANQIAMSQTQKIDLNNPLFLKFSAELVEISQTFAMNCVTFQAFIKSGTKSSFAIATIVPLEDAVSKLAKQIDQLRNQGEIRRISLEDIIQYYYFLHILTLLTREMDQLMLQFGDRKPPMSLSALSKGVRLHPIPDAKIKHTIKTGVALGLTLAIINFFNISFGYYAVVALVVAMQPTLGIGFDAGKQRVICTAIGAVISVVVVNSLGSNPFTVGLGVGLTILVCSYCGFDQGYKPGCIMVTLAIMAHSAEPNLYIWGRFTETILGFVIALVVSLLIWPDTASQQLDPSLSLTFSKLGQLYEIVINQYLYSQNSTAAIVQLSDEIRRSIRSQDLLLAETKLEPKDGLLVAQKQQHWIFLLSHAKTLLSNILSLNHGIEQKNSQDFEGFVREFQAEFEDSAQLTYQSFEALSMAIANSNSSQQLPTLAPTFEQIEQKLLKRRTQTLKSKYSLPEVITFFAVFSSLKEISDNLKQMAENQVIKR
jgi:uncharacterized membrane protein YgaE (UPF0421/DUF939 family)